ncbi:DNA polymerase III subunit gamma/tau [Pusillimonas minor]|uniref:DNA polymerase III subunit gamma/tau n=1 Tax=Pusillimonas minor TaxID=2697024 RepID=A0A842HQ51_9BURK|nr:DNA polymerase III subunit gamma/tau [Pusillimonas minor]MBC2770403.1 DNA polymerase III subunit gamma/tau [Pusillimonas minor]
MTYLVLARKWRPRSFDTLVGQDHVVRALTHALETQRLHHAWLFTGTRGVGKTTLSRLLAKSLNCETGITANPCGHCRACVEIDEGRFVDYVELDAASNRGVDEMTQLLEQAVYAPGAGRFKVYMIDEVHMLTGHAFNAMLKTLEEPPAHVKFILATTDPQKIPVTVLSRCLQFNLKQMTSDAIVGHLQGVLQHENIPFDVPALRLIAQAASGSMRDALSLTDQAIAYSAGQLSADAVRGMLGTIDQRYLVRLLQGLVAGSGQSVLEVADELATRGLSYSGALADLCILLSRIAIEQRVPGVAPADDPVAAELAALAAGMPPDLVQLFYTVAVHSRSELALAPDEYAGFVMACLRMLSLAPANAGQPLPPPSGPSTRTDSPAASATPQSAPAPVATSSTAPAPGMSPVSSSGDAAPVPGIALVSSGNAASASGVPPVAGNASPPHVALRVEDAARRGDPSAMAVSPTPESHPAPVQDAKPTLVQAPRPVPAPAAASARRETSPPQRPAVSTPAKPVVSTGQSSVSTGQAQFASAAPAGRASAASADDGVPAWEDIPADNTVGHLPDDDFETMVADGAYDDAAIMGQGYDVGADESYDDLALSRGPADETNPIPVDVLAGLSADAPTRRGRAPRLSSMDSKAWVALVASLPATGVASELARQSEWVGVKDNEIHLRVGIRMFADSAGQARLCTLLSEHFGTVVRLKVEYGQTGDDTAHAVEQAELAARQRDAEAAVDVDPLVQALVTDFGARVIPGSIRPLPQSKAA